MKRREFQLDESTGALLQRRIDLEPAHRFLATWEQHEPLERPRQPAFDFTKAIRRMKLCAAHTRFEWGDAEIPINPSAEEAQFWIEVLGLADPRSKSSGIAIAEAMAQKTIDGKMSLDRMAEIFFAYGRGNLHEGLLPCFAALCPPTELIDFLQLTCGQKFQTTTPFRVRAFRRLIVPYLSHDEREAMKTHLRKTYPQSFDTPACRPGIYAAATLGLHAETEQRVRELADGKLENRAGRYNSWDDSPEYLLFGLPGRDQVLAEARRLRLNLSCAESIFAWIALTEFEALDVVAESICRMKNKNDSAKMTKVLDRLIAPEIAPVALRVARDSRKPELGVKWLEKHPLQTVVGFIATAMGTGKLAAAAKHHLLAQKHRDANLLDQACQHLDPKAADWLQREVLDADQTGPHTVPVTPLESLPPDLRTAIEKNPSAAKLPRWLVPAMLPPIRVGTGRLALCELEAVLRTLKATAVDVHSVVIESLRQHAAPDSLDAFAEKVFDAWLEMGADMKEKWAMAATAHLGGDACVLRLTPLVRRWPGESQHKRAVFGLECLQRINTDTAIMALNGIASKLRYRKLKEQAQVAMSAIARARGLSPEELADRTVPDCGLDATGSREFDFGARQFRFVLGGGAKPMLRDADGKLRANLPRPTKTDDPERAAAANASWKILKKALRETLSMQTKRMEDAMVNARHWNPGDFDTFIVRHPLMVNLARQLVFGSYEGAGKLQRTFRITEDQSLADQNDDPFALPRDGRIGLVHPAQLDEESRSAWTEIFADYAIIPPFKQLARRVCQAEPDDLDQTEITRLNIARIPGKILYAILERAHWRRDLPSDSGSFSQHSKYYKSADTTAFIGYSPGLYNGYYDDAQSLDEVYFASGNILPERSSFLHQRLKIRQVDPIVLSEVLRMAHAIAAKGE